MSKFRNSAGQLLTQGLFLEYTSDPKTVLYSVKREPQGDIPSLFQLYMAEKDLSEYKIATKYFESVDHWDKLTATNWFAPIVAVYRRELEQAVKSEALDRIKAEAETGGKNTLAANRYLYEMASPDRPSRGRPSKKQVDQKAREIAQSVQRVSDDAKRLSLDVPPPVAAIPEYGDPLGE